jgi:murein DD-endopeptidase MepM/ murein hydrolase activator NlpD
MRNVLSGVLLLVALAAIASGSGSGEQRTADSGQEQPAPAYPLPAARCPLIPVQGIHASQLKSTFNEGRAGHLHHAIDILAPRGTPVLAAVDGTVRKLFVSQAGGITLYEYDLAGERSYYYAHLDGYAPGIHEGLALHRGDVLGYVGTTGNAPETTPHLHFAIEMLPPTKEWWKGEAIDPYPILTAPASALR